MLKKIASEPRRLFSLTNKAGAGSPPGFDFIARRVCGIVAGQPHPVPK
jgi:hypothetical protein